MKLEIPSYVSVTLGSNDGVQTFTGPNEVPDKFNKVLAIKIDHASLAATTVQAPPSSPITISGVLCYVAIGILAFQVAGPWGLLGLGVIVAVCSHIGKSVRQSLRNR